jgi:fucose permease
MAAPQIELSRSSSNKKLILAGQIAFLPTGVLTTLLGPMLPILIARWTLNDTQAGNLFLVQFLAMLAGVQLSGLLVARRGFRPAFLLGLFSMAAGAAAIYMGPHWLGLAAVAANGLGLGLVIPADNLMVAEISAEPGMNSAAAAVNVLNFFWGVGAVLCSLLIAWTAAHNLVPFFLGAVALFLILLALAMRNLPFPVAVQSDGSSVSWRQLAKSPPIWLFAAVFFLYPGVEASVGGWIGSFVARMGSHGASMASAMPAFFWSAMAVGRMFGIAFLRHFSERRVLQVGYFAAAAGIGGMLWSSSVPGTIGGALIAGLSFATLYPITVARLSSRFGVAARSIGAVMFSLASLGPAVLPWTVGMISHATGSLRAGLLLPLAATVVLFVVHLFAW